MILLLHYVMDRKLTVIHFWAPWSEPSKHMNEVMMELAKEHSKVKFFKVRN